MMNEPKRVYRGAGRVAFLAHFDDFRKLLEAGYPLREIYNNFSKQLVIGYPQFTKYVKRYMRKKKDEEDGHQKKAPQQIATQTTFPAPTGAAESHNEKRVSERPVFHHDPNSGNTRDDLI